MWYLVNYLNPGQKLQFSPSRAEGSVLVLLPGERMGLFPPLLWKWLFSGFVLPDMEAAGSHRIFWFTYSHFRNRNTNIIPFIAIHNWGKALISSRFNSYCNCGFFLPGLFSRLPSPGATHWNHLICLITAFVFLAQRGGERHKSQNNVQINPSWLRCDKKQGVRLKVVISCQTRGKLMIQSLHFKEIKKVI